MPVCPELPELDEPPHPCTTSNEEVHNKKQIQIPIILNILSDMVKIGAKRKEQISKLKN